MADANVIRCSAAAVGHTETQHDTTTTTTTHKTTQKQKQRKLKRKIDRSQGEQDSAMEGLS